MANKAIYQLPALSSITGTELIPCDIGGVTYSVSINQLKAFIGSSIGSGMVILTGGTSSAYTAITPRITSYSNKVNQIVQVHVTNADNATINFNGLGPLTMRVFGDENVLAGYLNADLFVSGIVNGAYFDIESVTNNIATGF